MKEVIPEETHYYCDRCKEEIDNSDIDCSGYADFVGRDYSGRAVGGNKRNFDFCGKCTLDFRDFLDVDKA